ncbi:protein RIC-3 [Hyperolius riggenbachi]|uniref:protein RIC-3 n=1 Tax=Hyperolius riggenbachi TaxID=752182 RepID=UPI0035A2F82E
MALSTIQKVALFSGLVLCVSLLLPKTFLSRGKLSVQQEGGPGRFPSATPHGKSADGRNPGTNFPRSHLSDAVSKSKTGGGGGSVGGRQSLVGQIIPIYGFGILLYILYILFKLSSKGKSPKLEPKSVPIGNGNLKRKITDYELSQLQDKLRETEEAMEKIISRLGPNCERQDNVSADEEQQLLQRLKEITRAMKEGKVLDGVSPEQEAEEAPYMEGWEGYPEETYPIFDPSDCKRKRDTILIDSSILTQPTAEEIAEQMGFGEEDEHLYTENAEEIRDSCDIEQGLLSDPAYHAMAQPEDDGDVEAWCDSDDEEDPAILAENAGFGTDSGSEEDLCMENSTAECTRVDGTPGATNAHVQDDAGTLRKRGKKGSEY